MVLILDNYDSFVYNIFSWLPCKSTDVIIRRNDDVSHDDLLHASHIIISPGPMSPIESGLCCDVIQVVAGRIPVLGICLGHQCIGHTFGCTVTQHAEPCHGKTSPVNLGVSPLYAGLGSVIEFARYHSLHISRDNFNHDCLCINATLDDGTIMGVEHTEYPIFGVQFHPESILSGYKTGSILLSNFLAIPSKNAIILKENATAVLQN